MRRKDYPLDAVVTAREAGARDAAKELARAVSERELAEVRRLAVEAERFRAEARAGEVRREERGALERGDLTVADLGREADWEVSVSVEMAALVARETRASEGADRARALEDEARQASASREAGVKVLEKDRARWHSGEERRAEAKEEEARDEAWRRR